MISILCPSRGRPLLAKRMIESALKTAGQPIEILLYINEDDPLLNDYKKNINNDYILIGPDRSPGYSWNRLAEIAKYDIFFLIGDDVEFSTDNWVKKVTDAFDQYSDKIVCVYPTVPGIKKKLNPHFCLHRNWVDALGYFVPPHFWHWYVDTWIQKIAKNIGRYHLVEDFELPIILDLDDETNQRKDRLCLRERDHYLWNKTNRRWLESDISELKKIIED